MDRCINIHIHWLCRACYYQLRQLRTVSRSLTSTAAATLVHLFVTSRLDYCSSLYIGLPATRLNCLNRVLRSAARLQLVGYLNLTTFLPICGMSSIGYPSGSALSSE